MPNWVLYEAARLLTYRRPRLPGRPFWGALGLAGLSGVLLFVCFPGFDLGAIAWIALVPLLLALNQRRLRDSFLLSWVTGIVFFTGGFYWIWSVQAYNLFDYVIVQILYLPQYITLFGLTLAWIRRRTGLSQILLAPPLWVTLEYIRAHLSFLSLPFFLLGHSQYLHPSLIQITSLTGVYGLSFVIVCVNVAVAELIIGIRSYVREPSAAGLFPSAARMSMTVAGVLLIGTALFGMTSLAGAGKSEHVKIAVLQGNVPQTQKWDHNSLQEVVSRYESMTRQAAAADPALIVWPETAILGDVGTDPAFRDRFENLALDTKANLLVGAAVSTKFYKQKVRGRYFNSLFLFSRRGHLEDEHHKIIPVPFGEYDPLHGLFEWPRAVIAATGSVVPGDRYTIFHLPDASFGAVICWESIFPDLFRQFVYRGARFMVNATDESWFHAVGPSSQFLAMTSFRAVENGVSIVRAANRGISAFIDPFGRIEEELGTPNGRTLPHEGVLVAQIALSNGPTFYTRHGELFAFISIAYCGILMVLLFSRIRILR
jgi:apolipoprotein N-acyltransferase